jgi:hypothetical protein
VVVLYSFVSGFYMRTRGSEVTWVGFVWQVVLERGFIVVSDLVESKTNCGVIILLVV